MINNQSIYQYDQIFITDIWLENPQIIQNDPWLKRHTLLIDHHESALKVPNFENYSLGVKCLFCLLPISPMVSWMRLAVNQHPYSLGFYLAASLFNAVLWLIIGLIMFEITNRNVRKNGSLALY